MLLLFSAENDTSKRELLKSQNELKSKIEHPFTGSKAELEQERDEHHSNLKRNSRELKEENLPSTAHS